MLMLKNTEVYNRGLDLLKKLHGGHAGEAIIESLHDICPDYATMTIEWGFGTMFSREGLDSKTRELAIISSCVTLGNAMPQLIAHILQTALCAGFPAVTNALLAAKELLSGANEFNRS
jgi:4-carboxymuconolactone decarboxylase